MNINSISKDEIGDQYIDCVNEETKPSNFYFDNVNEDYRICYETCATCDKGGNIEINNCKTCEYNHIKISTTNCIMKCPFYYYITKFNQYKCTKNKFCPSDYMLLIEEKERCIDDCNNDDTYKSKYDNKCLNECPLNTTDDNFNCKDNNRITLTTETNHLYFNNTENYIKLFINKYMDNFYYTNSHISKYTANNLNLVIYKDSISLADLSFQKLDFKNCYSKIKGKFNITADLIIASLYEKNKIISFSIYDPRDRIKINYNDICNNDSVIVEETIEDKIPDLDSFVYLADQGIDLTNPQSEFYTDICFHYESPIDGKDIPLKERFKLFYPHIPLCDKGCFFKGINTATNTSICECSLNNLMNSNLLGNNVLLQDAMDEFKVLIEDTNIGVLKCYKDMKDFNYFSKNIGSFIILGLIASQIILIIVYSKAYAFAVTKYLYNLKQNFISFLSKKNGVNQTQQKFNSSEVKLIDNKEAPPKRKYKCINILNNMEVSKKISEIGEGKKPLGKTGYKNDTKSEMPNQNKLRLHNNSETSDKDENKIQIRDDLISDTAETKKDHKNIEIKSGKKSRKASEIASLTHTKSRDKLVSNMKTSTKKKSTKKHVKIKGGDNKIIDGKSFNVEEYIKTDPDDMDYDSAIKRDHRSFLGYFSDNLIGDILILNIFCNHEPLNPWPIKLILFILNFELYLFVNALFFTEDYLTEMLYKNPSFADYINRFVDRLGYISLIGIIIEYIMNFFFYEEKYIKRIFKRERDDIHALEYEMMQIIKYIKIRFYLFFIVCFIFGIFIWYYIFCFNNIYPSMVNEWIITSIFIYIIMQILYLLKLLSETIIRFIAFKCKSERFFRISQFLS